MSKKPGQISSNTLSLRFMQNAAKAKQESAVEAANAKVRTDEEWELSPDIKQSWGIDDSEVKDHGHVTYEQSYLPFLFPGFSSSVTAPVASTKTSPNQSEDEDDEAIDTSTVFFKSRWTFGKHGQEETAKPSLPPVQQPPLKSGYALSRGARSISSHGRNLTSPSTPPKPRPQRHPVGVPSSSRNTSIPCATSASGSVDFMKPPVDGPQDDHGERKRRPSSDAEGPSGGNIKKKNRKGNELLNFS